MPYSITIHHTYSDVIIALAKEEAIIAQSTIGSKNISKECMLTIDILLSKSGITLDDLKFIAVNNGPGPFSTLRSIIASANGLHLAKNIPLLSVDGLISFYSQTKEEHKTPVITLLNAYSNDVYFAYTENNVLKTGYANIEIILQQIKLLYNNQTITFVGNGATLHREVIEHRLGKQVIIEYGKEHASIEHIVAHAYTQWQQKNNNSMSYLSAQYLKTY